MPIYEYECLDAAQSCLKCRECFEVLHPQGAPPAATCPACGAPVVRVVSRFRAATVEASGSGQRAETTLKDYEKKGMWSHAAELAEKMSEQTKDPSLRNRAFDDYKKAGYDSVSLDKHASASEGKL